MNVFSNWCASVIVVACAAAAQAQPAPPVQDKAAPDKNAGIPVTNDLVRSKCGGCHRSDDKGRMSRISYRRATPENWERTIKRMVALNHATLDPADARRQGLEFVWWASRSWNTDAHAFFRTFATAEETVVAFAAFGGQFEALADEGDRDSG